MNSRIGGLTTTTQRLFIETTKVDTGVKANSVSDFHFLFWMGGEKLNQEA
ncbi:hypothetical protein [Humisphaera borealis]|uniref:Uncharacterized protein n=1 Tax=Humisphaera borealis TaxID=2807512 RepID=A0A7M2WYV7_9BACT|nr:hypothetical protein [Humisphaera borealis]QOV90655.1 hypothetical protein IPV69_04640 [Humisphaera borealis]